MPIQQEPHLPGRKGVYDDELSSLPGISEQSAGISKGADNMVSKIDEALGQHAAPKDPDDPNDPANEEKNGLQSLHNSIAGASDRLGNGFTGAAGGVTGAAGTVYKSANAFAGPAGKIKLVGAVAGSLVKNRKALLAGGGGTALLTLLGVLLLGSLPFGFNSVMNGIVDKEMKVLKGNMSEMQNSLASYYIKKYVLPGMRINACTSTIVDKSCAVQAKGQGPVAAMFSAWQKGNIEAKWARQGFELKYDRAANRYFVRATGVGDIDISRFTGTNDNLFHEIRRPQVRALFQESHKHSSKWDRMMTRFGWGKKTLKINYRATRCVLTCKVLAFTDKHFTEPLQTRKQAFKIKLFQRVLFPRSEMYGLAFSCLFSGNECDPNRPIRDPDTGEYRTQFEEDIGTRMDSIRATQGGDITLERAETAVKEMREKGLSKYLVETMVKSILGKAGASVGVQQTTATVAGYALPGVNVIIGLSGIITILSTLGPILKSTNAHIQTHSAALQFGMNSTFMDEVQSGNVDATEVGSFNDAFTRGQELQADGKTMGGAGAGAVPLYGAVINNGAQTQTAFLNSLFGAKTYAASPDANYTNAYKCPVTGKVLDPSGANGELICPEQSLKYATYVAGGFGSVSDFLNQPGLSVVTETAKFISGVVTDVFSAITKPVVEAVQALPGYDAVVAQISAASAIIFEDLKQYMFPNWINDNQSGATNFVATDMGARVVANDYAQNVLRGQPLTPEQQYAVESNVDVIDEIQFKNKPLYARIFDKQDPHSFVTRLSLALPTDFRSNTGTIFTGLISDPFGKLMRGFGAVFSGQTAFAAPPKILPDPFGITHYGFPLENAVFREDPELFYQTSCNSTAHHDEWNSHVVMNPDTGLMEHQQPDACGILLEGVQMGGGLYDSALVGL